MRNITKGYIKHYERIKMEQTLPSGRHLRVEYMRIPTGKWVAKYETDSVYHICPYDGVFRNCKDCEAYNEEDEKMNSCILHSDVVTDDEMVSRAVACAAAKDCTINFLGY